MSSSKIIKNFIPLGFQQTGTREGPLDLKIDTKGKVEELAKNIESRGKEQVVDIQENFLTSGWVDLHTHIYYGATDISVDPDRIGPATGPVMLVDAGSAGEANFEGFKEYIVNPRKYHIKSYLNIGSIGLVASNRVSEFGSSNPIDFNRTKSVVEQNRDIIKGIKIRASKVILGKGGSEYVKIAKSFANTLNLPLIIHVGEPPMLLEDIINDILGPGDMLTHCFHGKVGGNLLSQPEFTDLYKEAQDKGILLDIGHGASSFSYERAKYALENGIKPFSISTDLHVYNVDGPVWDMPAVMSKMYALGLSLEEIITMVTANPAEFLGLEGWTEIKEGQPANFTVFELMDGDFTFEDSAARDDSTKSTPEERMKFQGSSFINPIYSIYNGNITEARSRYISRSQS